MNSQTKTAASWLSGKALAASIQPFLAANSKLFASKYLRKPQLAVVLVGDDPASLSYVTGKKKAAAKVDIHSELYHLQAHVSQEKLDDLVTRLAYDKNVDGILVQSPLPEGLVQDKVTDLIPPEKDVDCFHPYNVGLLSLGKGQFFPCTPHGILRLLEAYAIPTKGKRVVVVGRSNIVGKPAALMLLDKQLGNASVTVLHSASENLAQLTLEADILIAAIGKAHFIDASMVKNGAVVVDVGVNRVADPSKKSGYSLVGDVCTQKVQEKAAWLSPVPGGVGPMTITMLLYNVLTAAYWRQGDQAPKINWQSLPMER